MTSTAISAQGSTLQIGTGSGSAKVATGVQVGFPTGLVCAAHGFNNGDVVTLAGFTGADAAMLNGQTVSIENVTTNTFAIEINTIGKTITAGSNTMTPTAWTKVSNLKTFTGFDGAASEIDTTNLDSAAKEFRLGLQDPGNFSIEVDQNNQDAGQTALRAAQASGNLRLFKLTFPSGDVASFTALVKKFGTSLGVDQVIKGSIDCRISGVIAWA